MVIGGTAAGYGVRAATLTIKDAAGGDGDGDGDGDGGGGGGGGGGDGGGDGDGDGGDGGGDGGGGGNGGGGDPGGNRSPEAAQPLAAQTVAAGATLTLDIGSAFRDPDQDDLDYEVSTSDATVAVVGLDGTTLTVRGVVRGVVEITVTAADNNGGTVSQMFTVTVTGPEVVWFLPSASDPAREGFVRVVNHSDEAGEVTVTATDDDGRSYTPLTLALGARRVAHFNSRDLESGSPAKGLAGGTGPGTGGWRLELESATLDIEALAYLRTADGFLTAMSAAASARADGSREVMIFNPASNIDQVSMLRLVNPNAQDAEATVTGIDDVGDSQDAAVNLTVRAGTACTVDAAQLETGAGLPCGASQPGLGDGDGKWRLTVDSAPPVVVLNLLSSPTGHLTNLSETAAAEPDGTQHLQLFPAASNPHGRQGFVRVANRSERAGTVRIAAFDDTDVEYETLVLALDARAAAHFNSDDLELGNEAKGLSGSTGSGTGTWRLELSSTEIDFDALAYVRTADGFLTAMQALAPVADRVHRVAFFNPGGNANQRSVLRLANPGASDAQVQITGTDDLGVRPGTTVRLTVAAGAAVEVTAAELESGEADTIASGALGDGTGKWRLRIEADQDIAAMSLLSNPQGHLTNLSRSDGTRGFERTPAATLPPPAEASLTSPSNRRLRGRWSVVPGARYDIDLLRNGFADEDRSLRRSTRTSFQWSSLVAGTYAIRVRSVNEDGEPGAWGTALGRSGSGLSGWATDGRIVDGLKYSMSPASRVTCSGPG